MYISELVHDAAHIARGAAPALLRETAFKWKSLIQGTPL